MGGEFALRGVAVPDACHGELESKLLTSEASMSKDRHRYKSQSGGVKAGRGSDFAQDVVDAGDCGLGQLRAEDWRV